MESKNKKRQSRKLCSDEHRTTCCTQDILYLLTRAISTILETSQPVARISGILSTLLSQGIEKSDSMFHLYDAIKNDHECDGIFVVLRLENRIYLNYHILVW